MIELEWPLLYSIVHKSFLSLFSAVVIFNYFYDFSNCGFNIIHFGKGKGNPCQSGRSVS